MLLRRSLVDQWNRKDDQHLSTGLDHDVCPIDPKAWRDLGLYRVVMIERNHFFGFGETKKNYGPLFPWGFSRGYLSSLFRELFKQLRRHSLIHVCYWKKKRLEKKASSPKMQLKYFKRTESTHSLVTRLWINEIRQSKENCTTFCVFFLMHHQLFSKCLRIIFWKSKFCIIMNRILLILFW